MVGIPEELSRYLWELDKEKKYEIKEFREKRSLSQNAYAWKLITQIGDILRKSKEEVYLHMLQHYGQSEIISVRADINVSGYFKYYSKFGKGQVNGKEFIHFCSLKQIESSRNRINKYHLSRKKRK